MLKSDPERVPRIQTPLPGPRAAALIREDELYTSPSYTRDYPLVAARGAGAVIEDVDGNLFLDCTAGIAVCSTGHCHPRIVAAIHDQSQRLIHMSGTDFYYSPQKDLARTLAQAAPGDAPKRVFFTNSGAESVEAAFKLARYHTKRKRILAFRGAFHGRTLGALSLTASKVVQRRGFGPLIPGVTHIRYPRAGESCQPTWDELDAIWQTVTPPDEVAAVFVEPIQGEGGYLVPPDDFHPELRRRCDEHGILLVADEVQAGMGRTGKLFAMEHWGVAPDIICLAKGIASGLPLGAIVARSDVMDWPPGAHASTFGGNPVACAAALETIALLRESLLDNAAAMGTHLQQALRDLRSPHIVEVRGKGLMVGVELSCDRNQVVQRCFEHGLLLLGCGTRAIRFCPPLVINADQIDVAVSIFGECLSAV